MKGIRIFVSMVALIFAGVCAYGTKVSFKAQVAWFQPSVIAPCIATSIDYFCVPDPVGGCLGPHNRPSEGLQLFLTEDCDQVLAHF